MIIRSGLGLMYYLVIILLAQCDADLHVKMPKRRAGARERA